MSETRQNCILAQDTNGLDDSLRVVTADKTAFAKAIENMTPLASRMVDPRQVLPLDLFLPFTGRDASVRLMRVFNQGSKPTEDALRRARGLGMDQFFAPKNQHKLLLEYIARRTLNVLHQPEAPVQEKCEAVYDNAMLLIRTAIEGRDLAENLEQGLNYAKVFASVVRENPVLLYKLPDLLKVNYDLYNHSVNVCVLSTAFGAFLKLPMERLTALSAGALYHDIGKRDIDPLILEKPTSLDEKEWQVVRRHPIHSHRILANHPILPGEAMAIAMQHHENLDGSGYPHGLRGEAISYLARIVRIVDAYDAITSERCYKSAMRPMEAVQVMIDEMGGALSMDLLRMFLRFMAVIAEGQGQGPGEG